jgi:hypothetical protein
MRADESMIFATTSRVSSDLDDADAGVTLLDMGDYS